MACNFNSNLRFNNEEIGLGRKLTFVDFYIDVRKE